MVCSETCEIFAIDCFFLYNKALLEMRKIESAVLGNVFEGFEHQIVEEEPEFSQVESDKVRISL